MPFLFRRIFWGILILTIGVLILLQNVLGIDLPIWGIFWAIVIIAIGISIMLPKQQNFESYRKEWQSHVSKGDVLFDEGRVEAKPGKKDYNIIFGKGEIDLTKISPKEKNIVLEVNAIFGGGTVLIDEGIPMKLKATGVFGGTKLPDGTTAAFGDAYYTTRAYKEDSPALVVHVNSIFGGLDIIEKNK